ncbi:hypothetical protein QBC46DRAFT_6111 [Diplogelasinospora grovesii]|uniref:Uncharacterized protein n=1 Tax=Diplogelasinospora grovesii TaxID=303347 RepID=A0AAN6NKE7_9PEZI|nr:hypothetical protein QBC46DRAFT_6111 [Diplogelasinospora grovesii]
MFGIRVVFSPVYSNFGRTFALWFAYIRLRLSILTHPPLMYWVILDKLAAHASLFFMIKGFFCVWSWSTSVDERETCWDRKGSDM